MKIIASLKNTCLNKVVLFVVLLHSTYVFVSVSSLVPLISGIALAVSFIDKSKEILDFVAFVYLSMLVLASTNSIGLLTPPPAPATNVYFAFTIVIQRYLAIGLIICC